jgi:hypothetical protein
MSCRRLLVNSFESAESELAALAVKRRAPVWISRASPKARPMDHEPGSVDLHHLQRMRIDEHVLSEIANIFTGVIQCPFIL